VGADRKSLAVHVSFRAPDRTLTDQEVDREVAALTEKLRALGGELRA
jgi:phenylalanyl-tRNA synthetase beta subunit